MTAPTRFIDLPTKVQNGIRRRMKRAAKSIDYTPGVIEIEFYYRRDLLSAWCEVIDKPKPRVRVKNYLSQRKEP